MKILVITDLYPPHIIGGYELICGYAVDGLRDLGHQVLVLTSTYGITARVRQDSTWRVLHEARGFQLPGKGLAERTFSEWQDQRVVEQTLRSFGPDVVYFWNAAGLLPAVLTAICQSGVPVAYHLCDYWIFSLSDGVPQQYYYRRWHRRAGRWPAEVGKRLARSLVARQVCLLPPQIKPTAAAFVSGAVRNLYRQQGIDFKRSEIIHPGVPHLKWVNALPSPSVTDARLLFAGRVCEDKGVHTAIAALDILVHRYRINAKLKIVGGDRGNGYLERLRRMICDFSLEKHVKFVGHVSGRQVRSFMSESHILLFPSVWAEPLALTPIEAMGSGIVVVGTTTGGSGELLKHGNNSLTFDADNAEQAAEQVVRLVEEPGLYDQLRESAHKLVTTQHTQSVMATQISSFLQEVAETGRTESHINRF